MHRLYNKTSRFLWKIACPPPLPVCLTYLLIIKSFKNNKLEEGSSTLL